MASTRSGPSNSIDRSVGILRLADCRTCLLTQQSDPQAIFARVYDTYKSGLPRDIQNDLANLSNARDVVEKFKKLARENLSRPSKIRKPLQAIARIADALQPYFEVVDIYVQTHPEYAGLVWGSLRFIFTVKPVLVDFSCVSINAFN